jgi:hypothetical protein
MSLSSSRRVEMWRFDEGVLRDVGVWMAPGGITIWSRSMSTTAW